MTSFRRSIVATACTLACVTAAACFVPAEGARRGPAHGTATSTAPLGTTECVARCEEHARTCEGAADAAAAECNESCKVRLSRAAIRCIEALACTAAPTAVRECVATNPERNVASAGVFGDACQCADGASECAGGCGEGLSCARPAVGAAASCVGPVCCEGAACAQQLGKAATCGAGRVCGCASGESQCDRGLCVVDH